MEDKGLMAALIIVTSFLLVCGLIIMYSASSYSATTEMGDGFYYLRKQGISCSIGAVVLLMVVFFGRVLMFKKVPVIIYVLSIISVLAIVTPIGHSANGAKRWLKIGGMTMQPAEFVKLAVIIIMAYMLGSLVKKELDGIGYALMMAPAFVGALLIVGITQDLGSAVIILIMAIILAIVSRQKWKYIVITFAVIIVVGVLAILLLGNRMGRILAWLNPSAYSSTTAYQITQAKYAIGSGGLFGKGLGKSIMKIGRLPEAETDMIFSIVCEEMGIIGGMLLMVLFVTLIIIMIYICKSTRDKVNRFLVAGVAAHIGTQTFINLAVVTGLFPNTGVTLPFISYGGTSLIFLLAEIGIVLYVCRANIKADVKIISVRYSVPHRRLERV